MYNKDADIGNLADEILDNPALLEEVLDGLKNKNEILRYNCNKALKVICARKSEVIYPYWDLFVEMLDSPNTYHKLSAVELLACLADADEENKYDTIFKKFFSMLGDRGTILAMYIAMNAGKIAKAKPHLRERITDVLLDIDSVYQGKQLELTKGSIIESFDGFFEDAHYYNRNSWYPAVEDADGHEALGAHTDHNFMALLPMSAEPGLMYATPSGDWFAAPLVEGAICVNTGEFLNRWSNGRFLPTRLTG